MATKTQTVPTSEGFEQRIVQWESENLCELAARSYPARRDSREEPCTLRTPFQRDRDRIVHCKSFRRLKHKTQVFIAPEGDHYRTRLTHTFEVCCISRTVARALRLNEDLTEAVSLGHDLGHTPFGHIGEEVLDSCLMQRFGKHFRHNVQSLRLVEKVENDGRGLNLTEQVRDGIVNHTGDTLPATLEGRIVRLVDRVAYINHDIDDAVRAGILSEDDLPRGEIEILGASGRERIDRLVHDIVEQSAAAGDIVQSDEVGDAMHKLRQFMFERVYLGGQARAQHPKVETVLTALFNHYCENPEQMASAGGGAELDESVTDYIAGMTDRFAIRTFKNLTIPQELDV